ncbi:MAG: type II toxin-antitoxin system HicA family toxin [Patescibacteria group bacterium]
MPKNISWRKLVQKFRRLGFDGPYSGGRHLFMARGVLKVHIPNPHRGDISKHLVAEILKQASISIDEWDNA